MIEHLWFIALGFAAGLLGSMTGLGGGIITVPVMVFLGFPHTLAASNSLLATLSNAIASTIVYSRQKRIEYRLAIKMGLLSTPGTIIGALVTSELATHTFEILFGIVLVIAAIYLILRSKFINKQHEEHKKTLQHLFPGFLIIVLAGVSFFAGVTSAFFGIGGGIIFIPLMVTGLAMSMKRAAPTSQMILLFTSVSGITVHGLLGNPDFFLASLLAIGAFVGGLTGAHISMGTGERNLRILAFGAILATAIKIFYDAILGDENATT